MIAFIQRWNLPDESFFIKLLLFLVRFGWFRYRDSYFIQTRGLAMGHPHSPPLANLLVALLIEQHMVDMGLFQKFGIHLYHRFLDDGIMIADICRARIPAFFEAMEELCPALRFTWECFPLERPGTSTSFLDLQLYFVGTRQLAFNLHEKQLNRYLYIYSDSLHSQSMKASLIKTELIRYARNCSAREDFLRCKEQFWLRLRLRGYSRLWLARHFHSIQYDDRALFLRPVSRKCHDDLLPFKIRYTLESAALNIRLQLHSLATPSVYRELGKPALSLDAYMLQTVGIQVVPWGCH